MSILITLLLKFLVFPFIFLIIPIFLVCWLVLAYDDPSDKDPYEGKEGEDWDGN